MFNMFDLYIDTIQNGKKQYIAKYIKNPVLQMAWTDYVNKQSSFLHTAVQTQLDMVTEAGKAVSEAKVGKLLNPLDIDWFTAGWDAYVKQSIEKDNKTKAASKKAE